MWMNVSGLLKSSVGAKRTYNIDENIKINDKDTSVRGEAVILRTHRGILVRADLDTGVELECSRCLCPFRTCLRLHFEEEFFPIIDVNTGAAIPLPEEPGGFTTDEQHNIDLTEAVRQYILVAAPMKPLCRENCGGLCPVCGQNLNNGTCRCPSQPIDPRWSKLSKLLHNSHE